MVGHWHNEEQTRRPKLTLFPGTTAGRYPMTMLVLHLPGHCARSLDGWGFLSSHSLLGADSHTDETKESMRVTASHTHRAGTSAGSQRRRRSDSQSLLCRLRATWQLWRSGAQTCTCAHACTHTNTHMFQASQNNLTDHTHALSPQLAVWESERAPGGSNGGVSGPSERGTTGQGQESPPSNIQVLSRQPCLTQSHLWPLQSGSDNAHVPEWPELAMITHRMLYLDYY